MDQELVELANKIAAALSERKLMLALAESCTGGWMAKVLTDIPGSSHWFERGFVTYTNPSKQEMLGVSAARLEKYGAVSVQTVAEMARGALENSHAQLSVAISGIAGPGGATVDKPVGMVCFAWAMVGQDVVTRVEYFDGDREQVRRQAVRTAMQGVLDVFKTD